MLTRDRLGALLLLAFSVFYGVRIFHIPLLPFQADQAFTARTLPEALAVLGIVLSLILLFKRGSAAGPDLAGFRWVQAGLLCGLMVIYGLTVRPGGFLIATSLFLIGGFLVLGERRVVLILGASVPLVVAFWALMTQVLGVYIPPLPTFFGD
ncbi:MAG: tripartite tricarboxylate transporter TctB family protein [Inquilinaceae bacterium]